MKQLSSRVISSIGVIVLILSYAVIVCIVLLTKRRQSEREKDNRLKKHIMVSKQWNEITKATYKNNLSDVKKELLKDVHNSDLMISMKIACIAGYTSIVKVLLHQFLRRNLTTLDDEGNTPLLCASIAVNLSIVDFLLYNGAEVNVKNRKGETPLLLACQSDRVEVINRLIEAKADMTACNNDGVNALMYACGDGTLNVVRMILNRTECNVNDVDTSKRSPLFHACSSLSPSYLYETLPIESKIVAIFTGTSKSVWSKRHTGVTRFLINNKAAINMVDERGVTPLMIACREKCEKSVELLLNNNAEINATDNINSSSALLWAMQGNPDIHMMNIIKRLVYRGADVDIIDARKNTSLLIACYKMNDVQKSKSVPAMINASRYYCVQIVDLFLRKRVDVNAKNDFNESSLILACRGDHVDIIEKLVHAEADLKRDAFNAFCAACEYGSVESVKTLNQLKTLDTKYSRDRSLLFHACSALHFKSVCSSKCPSLIGFIIGEYGGVNVTDNLGVTPLMLACKNNCPKAVEVLLNSEDKAFIDAADRIDGSTAVAWAMRWKTKNDNIAVIKILVNNHADCQKSNDQGFSPVMLACALKQREIIQVFIDNVQDGDHEKPLRIACQNSLQFLLVQEKNSKNLTFPEKSFSKLDVDTKITMIADLVKYKRKIIEDEIAAQNNNDYLEYEDKDAESDRNEINDTNSTDNDMTPLLKAFEINNMDIVRLLIEGNVDINKCDGSNVTPLMKACELDESNIDILKLLIKKTEDINAQNNEGQTALFITCNKRNPSFKIVQSLFDDQSRETPNCTIGNNFNRTPLMTLFRNFDEKNHNFTDIIIYLINHFPVGYDFGHKLSEDKTYLSYACKYASDKIVHSLLQKGAKVNDYSKEVAKQRGDMKIINLLLLQTVKFE